MSNVQIVGPSLKPWINYLDRLSREPTVKTQTDMKSVLDAAYITARLNAHVISGRLLTSSFVTSEAKGSRGRAGWSGAISFGQGVRYAKYEMGERRKGSRPDWTVHPSHDPYDGLEMYYPAFQSVINKIF